MGNWLNLGRKRAGERQRAALGAWLSVDLTEARRRAEHHRKLASAGVRVTSALTPAAALSSVPETTGELFATWLALYASPSCCAIASCCPTRR